MKLAKSLFPKLLLILGACVLDTIIDLGRLWPFALAATLITGAIAWSQQARPEAPAIPQTTLRP